MPSAKKSTKSGGAKKSFRAAASNDDNLGSFLVHVKNEWRHVSGFQLFEFDHEQRVDEDGITTLPRCREWYCSNIVAPPGGFKEGHYGFQPKSKAWTSKFFESVSLFNVDVRQMEMVIMPANGTERATRFLEIEDERGVVKKAYKKLPIQNDLGSDDEGGGADASEDEEEGEKASVASEEEDEPPAKKVKKSPQKTPAKPPAKKTPSQASPKVPAKKTPSKASPKPPAKKTPSKASPKPPAKKTPSKGIAKKSSLKKK